jgi:Flp pilus assembly pilin Flp
MSGIAAPLLHLRRDRRGITLVEFGLILPAMMIMLMGLGDVLYQAYAQEMLSGSIQKAARDSAIQGGSEKSTEIDNQVITMLDTIMVKPTASCAAAPAAGTFCSTRQNYAIFSAAGPEPFNDDNNNGQRDAGECYLDTNGNGSWDATPSPGATGQGGANDVALYKMSITYNRLFPIARLIGLSQTQTISAQALLKNQPYATRTDPTVATKCT